MTSIADKLQRKPARGNKQVRLRLVYVDFWSALKLSAVIGFVLGIIQVVVVIVVWALMSVVGLFDQVDAAVRDILSDPNFTVMSFASLPQLLLFTLVVAVLNFIVITVLGAIIAVLYNLSVRVTGGLLVGFSNQ